MKVYIVVSGYEYTVGDISGVHAARESAERQVAQMLEGRNRWRAWVRDLEPAMPKPEDTADFDYCDIQEHDVKQ